MKHDTPPVKVASTDQLGPAAETLCMCKDRPLSACPGEWEPGCDLGNNSEYARPVQAASKEQEEAVKAGRRSMQAEIARMQR